MLACSVPVLYVGPDELLVLRSSSFCVFCLGALPSPCTAFYQLGYITPCWTGTWSGSTCAWATCAPGYVGTLTGSVTCFDGNYTSTLAGCVLMSGESAYKMISEEGPRLQTCTLEVHPRTKPQTCTLDLHPRPAPYTCTLSPRWPSSCTPN